MNKNKVICILLSLFLFVDFTYSFLQYYHTPLDGDMASAIIPSNDVKEVFEDPFGIFAVVNNEPHLNPNRYFSHLFLKSYYNYFPLFIQRIISPIESVYLSSAIIKICIQILFIYLLGALISKTKFIFSVKLLTAMVIITPLFQAYGYNRYMGIIDKSISYVFFYALPLLFLLFFFHPFYYKKNLHFSFFNKIILFLLVIILPFSGPLVPPIILITSLCLGLYYSRINIQTLNLISLRTPLILYKKIPKNILHFFIPICLLSLYSLFLGNYNSLYQASTVAIFDRYLKLPIGVYYLFTQKLGYLLLFIVLASNVLIIRKYFYNEKGKALITNLKWITAFSLIYILLLPLGGYRPYRENILRYDTFMPITICLIYAYGATSYFLIKNIKTNKRIYITLVLAFILIFTNADKSGLNENDCEKKSLLQISNSKRRIVELGDNCNVLSWNITTDYKSSRLNSELLYLWHITSDKKLFYNKQMKQK